MRDPYAQLAPRYDRMADDPAIRAIYRDFRRALTNAAAAHRMRPRVIVDLACGTGNTAIPWARARGRTVVGVDVSEAMLRVARRKSRRVRWVRQDLTHLSLGVTADAATCHFDALNHILEAGDLQRIFTNTARLLRPGGLFLFDLNTRFFLRWLSTSEKLFRAGPDLFVARNAFDPKSGVATFRQLWFVKHRQLYRKVLVTVRERSFEDAEIRRMLRAAGLRLETTRVVRQLKGRPIRKLYVAVRPGASGRRSVAPGTPPSAS
ncbi:MAG: methyltransferase domain-containing protein [Thermoanaerobaculia bacterium]